MKIGIYSDQRYDDRFSSSFEYLPDEVVLYDTELPAQVRRSLEIVSSILPSRIARIPLANQTEQAHHGDYGLVFRLGEVDNVELLPGGCCTDFTRGIVTARISMGMPQTKDKIGDKEIILKNPSELARLHLNVYGARNFLPVKEVDKQDPKIFEYISEELHFSLRWVNGKFDNVWNDPAKWLEEKDSRYMSRPDFNNMRTTYLESNSQSNNVNGGFYKDLTKWVPPEIKGRIERGEKILTLEDIQALIGTGKERILPGNIDIQKFLKLFPQSTEEADARKAAGYNFKERKDFPHIGYSPVLKTLSRFGDVTAEDAYSIPSMSMDQGVEYIFGKVLPAVEKFTQA